MLHKNFTTLLLLLLSYLCEVPLFGQADFQVASSACMEEYIELVNTSLGDNTYEWDFCPGDFDNAPSIQNVFNSSIFSQVENITLFQENDQVFVFVCSGNGSVYRATSSLNNLTSLSFSSLSSDGFSFSRPIDFSVIKIGTSYYGYMVDFSASKLYEYSFGESLSNQPDILDLGGFGSINQPHSVNSVIDNGVQKILISNIGSNYLTLVRKEDNVFSSENILTGTNQLWGFDIMKIDQNWIIPIAYRASSLVKILQFGNEISVTPLSINNLNDITNPSNLNLYLEDSEINLMVKSVPSGLYRMNFGENLIFPPTIQTYGNLGSLNSNHRGFALLRDSQSTWTGLIANTTRTVERIDFPNDCAALPAISTLEEPTVSFSQSGTYSINLVTMNDGGNYSAYSSDITILPQTAPTASFSNTTTECVSVPTAFTPSITGLSYQWDFDNDGIVDSFAENPSYQFPAAGTYTVRLDVDDGTCANFVRQDITLYEEPPLPDFAVTGDLCSSSILTFENLTDDALYEGPLTYSWDFDGEFTTEQRKPEYAFGSSGTKTITLTAGIPGCENTVQQVIELVDGPTAQFAADPICAGGLMTFTNQSVGATSYLWDFGDGYSSTQANASHVYSTGGNYLVTLEATAADGCTGVYQQEVAVAYVPVASFDYDIPCAGSQGIDFFDQSSVTAADILTWEWYVNNVLISTEQNPTLTYDEAGTYTVRLEVLGSNGCSSFIQKTVTVEESPEPAYTVDLKCQGQPSVFTDITEGQGMVSRLWSINGQDYTTATVQHVFAQSGTFPVSLTVTSADFCTSTVQGSVTVAAAPAMDFTLSSVCADEAILLTDTSIPSNPVVSRTWLLDGEAFFNGPQALLTGVGVGMHEVSLQITTAAGCVFTKSSNINFLASPVAGFNTSVAYGVPPFAVTLTNTSTGASAYVWRVNGQQVSTATNFTYTVQQEGTIGIALTAVGAGGCTDTFSRTLLSATPAVDLRVAQVLLIEKGSTQNISVTLTNTGNLPVEIFDVNVRAGRGFFLSERFNTYVGIGDEVTVGISSDLQLTDSKSVCVSVQSAYADATPDNNEACETFSDEVIFDAPYPNPFRDEAVIRLILPEVKDVRVTISHVSGKTRVDEMLNELSEGLHVLRYPSLQWEKGMYVVRLQVGSRVVVRKILRL